MDTNKMREQFEAAYAAKSTARNGRFYPGVLTRCDDGEYVIPSVQSAWWAWQASREAVVVELPNRSAEAYREEFDDVEGGSFNEAAYIRDVRKAIEAQGLKVAP
ncbi:hypothetical protein EGJ22_06680 [Pseudomonas sp. p99-361]|uniref:hypothetical protein n=1 Tax=unclassified Pseudomonas TaxID=196821 RepID=UPI00067B5EC5|nr:MULTISPECIES: hypothetical protein [unclassified Pseudomonas]RRV20980.1 hypothetical protein EGJ22_06680 [Pseudomonas sp. p99-361]CAH0649402.1 hypothetical protein PSNVIR_03679 [Pseudomonas sp. Nvir]